MKKRLIFVPIIILLLAACSPDTADRLSALEAEIEAVAAQNADLEAQLKTLEAEAEEPATEAANVAVAQFIMDTAGFHGMEETLNESGEIDPGYLGTVSRVRKVVANTQWPEPLAPEAASFVAVLAEYAEVLEADDPDAAASLSAEAHEAQHDFSHNVDNWLGGGDHQE
jgi:hypothetical protein